MLALCEPVKLVLNCELIMYNMSHYRGGGFKIKNQELYGQSCTVELPPPHAAKVHVRINEVGLILGVNLYYTVDLANPNSLGPEPIQISEIFGLVKATAATCVIVFYLHSVLGSLGSLPLLHVRSQNTQHCSQTIF